MFTLVLLLLSVDFIAAEINTSNAGEGPQFIKRYKRRISPSGRNITIAKWQPDGYDFCEVDAIGRFKLLHQGQDETATSFYLVPSEVLPTLKIAKPQGFNIQKCKAFESALQYDLTFTLFSFAAFVFEQDADIVPSILYSLTSGPREVWIETGPNILSKVSTGVSCNSATITLEMSFESNAIIADECISNKTPLPGDAQYPDAKLPAIPVKCENSQYEFRKYLSWFKYGEVQKLNNVNLTKYYLTRVGPIAGSIIYYNAAGTIISRITNIVFLGWEKNLTQEFWIVAMRKSVMGGPIGAQYVDRVLYEERIPFNITGSTSFEINGHVVYDEEESILSVGEDTVGVGDDEQGGWIGGDDEEEGGDGDGTTPGSETGTGTGTGTGEGGDGEGGKDQGGLIRAQKWLVGMMLVVPAVMMMMI